MTLNLGLTPEQLAERRKGIGASDAYTVIRGTPEDRYALYLDKIGAREPRRIMSEWQAALRYATEGLQLDWYEHTHPGEKVDHRGLLAVSAQYPFMRCTPDGVIFPPYPNAPVPIDAKHVSRWTKEGRDWAIEHYTPQIIHQCVVFEAPYGLISLIVGEKEPEIVKIEVDPWFAEDLIEAERAFWQCVESRTPPPDCAPLAIPKQAVEVEKLRTIDLMREAPNWKDEMVGQIERFANTDAAAKINGMARNRIKELLPDDVGELRYGLFRARRSRANAITMVLEKGEDDGSPE